MTSEFPIQTGHLDFAIERGQVFADDGKVYSSVQRAENAASNWMLIGPGDYNEIVTFDTPGLYVGGCGRGTRIFQGSSSATITISADDVTLDNFSFELTSGLSVALDETGDPNNCLYNRLWLRDSSLIGARFGDGNGTLITGMVVEGADSSGMTIGQNSIAYGCHVSGTATLGMRASNRSVIAASIVDGTVATVGGSGIVLLNPFARAIGNQVRGVDGIGLEFSSAADDTIAVGNTIENPGGDGVQIASADAILSACRIHSAGAHGVDVNGTDDIVTNNRISGSTNDDLNTAGATTPTTANNVTGAANS